MFLDAISNVREIFPGRNRSDGLNYLIDFDLVELEKLRVHERVDPTSGEQIYPQRFPWKSEIDLKISTLNETLQFLLGFRRSTNRNLEILIELKNPEFYRPLQRDISTILISTLKTFNLTKRDDPIFIQSFSINELEFLRRNLSTEIRLVALLPEKSEIEPDFLRNETKIELLSKFVDGIAPSFDLLIDFNDDGSIKNLTSLSFLARKNNLKIYPWTFRKDVFGSNFEPIVEYFSRFIDVDGFIASQPDLILQILRQTVSNSNRVFSLTGFTIFIVIFGFYFH